MNYKHIPIFMNEDTATYTKNVGSAWKVEDETSLEWLTP
jgi:hypothetical protein